MKQKAIQFLNGFLFSPIAQPSFKLIYIMKKIIENFNLKF